MDEGGAAMANGTANLMMPLSAASKPLHAAAVGNGKCGPGDPGKSPRMPWYARPVTLGVAFSLGCLLLLIGLILGSAFPGIFRRRIEATMPLVNGSVTFKSWSSPSVPIYMQFWLFNITNPDEFIAGGKPVLNQVGPFTYVESRQKSGVRFNAENGTLIYRQATYYHFLRNMSCCWDDIPVTMLNLPYVGVTYKLQHSSMYIRQILDRLFVNGRHRLVATRQARELLWGYKDTALATLAPIARIASLTINPIVGLFAGKNGSDGGEYSIFTGSADIKRLATIASWRGSDRLTFWSTPQANMINGTDGAMFPPFVSKSERLYLFSSDICRSIYLTYNGDVLLHNAVPLYRFQAPAAMFMNATLNPDNAGFCVKGHCLDSGVLNMSGCVPGTPAVMSQPHFYQAAPQYQQAVLGISPGPEFDTVLDIEPNTGFVMRAAKKLQLNMAVFPVDGFQGLAGRRGNGTGQQPLLIPVLWLNESVSLDAGSAVKFRDAVLRPKQRVALTQWYLIGLGALTAALVATVAVILHRRRLMASVRRGRAAFGSASSAPTTTAAAVEYDPERSDARLLSEGRSVATSPTSGVAPGVGIGAAA